MGHQLPEVCLDHSCRSIPRLHHPSSNVPAIHRLYRYGRALHRQKLLFLLVSEQRGPEPALDDDRGPSHPFHPSPDHASLERTLDDGGRMVFLFQHLQAAPLLVASVPGLNENSTQPYGHVAMMTRVHPEPRLNLQGGSVSSGCFGAAPFPKSGLNHRGGVVFHLELSTRPVPVTSLDFDGCRSQCEIVFTLLSSCDPSPGAFLDHCRCPPHRSVVRKRSLHPPTGLQHYHLGS